DLVPVEVTRCRARRHAPGCTQRHVVAVPAMIAEDEVRAAERDMRALGEAREGANHRIFAIIVDNLEALAGRRREAVDEREVERRAAEIDGAVHLQLIEAAGAGAADLITEVRAGIERNLTARQDARA